MKVAVPQSRGVPGSPTSILETNDLYLISVLYCVNQLLDPIPKKALH